MARTCAQNGTEKDSQEGLQIKSSRQKETGKAKNDEIYVREFYLVYVPRIFPFLCYIIHTFLLIHSAYLGLNLIQLVREPLDVLYNQELRPNAHYYITKVGFQVE